MIKIFADSTCDLSNEVLEKYDISLAPLVITINGKEYKDRIDITPDEFYEQLPNLENLPTTAMPSPVEFINIIEEGVKKGYKDFLCITMSSGTSGSYQSAMIAKEDYLEEHPDSDIRIHVVDSKCMSHGSGYLLLKSAILRDQGASFEELIDFNETYKTNIKHFLAVEDLNNLIKSGRLTNVSAMIGKMLKINPIMSMRSGKGAIVAKVRSKKKVYTHYVEELKSRLDKNLADFLIIGYTSMKEKAFELKSRIQNETNFDGDIYLMQMGVSVGTHVGLGGISIFFAEEGDRIDGLIYNELKDLRAKKEEMLRMLEKYRLPRVGYPTI
jgi:DegV family protein with EDD domain